jgi:hypothetical protein
MEQSRRVFLGTAASVAAGAATFFPVRGLSAQSVSDPLGDALDRELSAAVRLLATNQTGEPLRRVAAMLRLSALHRAPGDAKLKVALRAYVRREGREAALQRTMDPIELESNVRQLGLRFAVTPPNPPRAIREKVLDEFLAHGMTPLLRNGAANFDTMSVELDRRAGAVRPVIDYTVACRMQEQIYDTYSAGAAITCIALPGSPACIGITAAAITQLGLLYYYGCR